MNRRTRFGAPEKTKPTVALLSMQGTSHQQNLSTAAFSICG